MPTDRWATPSWARSAAGRGGPRALLIGHLDTVFPEGTAAERPFRIEAGIARGPGVTDMKGGLLTGLYAILALISLGEGDEDRPARATRRAGELPFERLVFVANPDEEIGSISSTPRHPRAGPRLGRLLSCSSAPGPTATSCRPARAPWTCA